MPFDFNDLMNQLTGGGDEPEDGDWNEGHTKRFSERLGWVEPHVYLELERRQKEEDDDEGSGYMPWIIFFGVIIVLGLAVYRDPRANKIFNDIMSQVNTSQIATTAPPAGEAPTGLPVATATVAAAVPTVPQGPLPTPVPEAIDKAKAIEVLKANGITAKAFANVEAAWYFYPILTDASGQRVQLKFLAVKVAVDSATITFDPSRKNNGILTEDNFGEPDNGQNQPCKLLVTGEVPITDRLRFSQDLMVALLQRSPPNAIGLDYLPVGADGERWYCTHTVKPVMGTIIAQVQIK